VKNAKTDVSRELGLEAGFIGGKYFLKLDHLHYGYWTSDIEVDIANLHLAQEEYAKFVISHIPDGVKTILDVGCGSGQIAKMLLDRGYDVDCVSPSPFLTKQVSKLLGDRSYIFECFYEDLQTANRYDMVMFCESFQYIDMEPALANTDKLLNSNGYLLICDIFRKEINDKTIMGGGHKITKFNELITKFPFRLIEDMDITEQTAPNMDLLNDVLQNVIRPLINAGAHLFESRHPTALKLLRFKYRKKINKLQKKYLVGGRAGEDFKKCKSYQLFLYKKDAQESNSF